MISVNKNPEFVNNFIFGVCQIADGLVKVLSLGKLQSTFTIDLARNVAKKRLKRNCVG